MKYLESIFENCVVEVTKIKQLLVDEDDDDDDDCVKESTQSSVLGRGRLLEDNDMVRAFFSNISTPQTGSLCRGGSVFYYVTCSL
jgi:hypothetical protein